MTEIRYRTAGLSVDIRGTQRRRNIMFDIKLILVCTLGLGHATLAAIVPRADSQWEICGTFKNPVDVNPQWMLNNDDVVVNTVLREAPPTRVLTVQGVCPIDSNGKYGVRINVDYMTIFDPNAAPIGDPEQPLPDSDDFEHIRLYFANEDYDCDKSGVGIPCHRITEIRFDRFWQYSIRLLSRPYKVLKESGFSKQEINSEAIDETTWKGDMTFEVDLLPKNLTHVAAFIIDPTQEQQMDRYLSEYRLYNHPISVIDLQVVTSYKALKQKDVDNIVRPEDNNAYSSYWDELENNTPTYYKK